MYQEHIDFEIKPIFSPSMEVCKDFVRVQISRFSSEEQKKIEYYKNLKNFDFNSSGDKVSLSGLADMQKWILYANLDKAYFSTWYMENNAFAFAAYIKEEMVGFISGALSGNNMFTRSLYVLPQYQGCGVGSHLLETAERAASFIVSNMELFSLDGADGFYNAHNYKNTLVQGRVMKIKNLPKTETGVVPVFGWNNVLQARLNIKVNINLFDCKYQPIFVYVNKDKKIDGLAILYSNGKDFIKFTKKGGDVAKQHKLELLDALSNVR